MSDVVPPEVEELLTDEPAVAHLATCTDGGPHVAPLWYRYEDDVVEIATTGTKLENLRQNEKTALSIQSSENGMPEWMVTMQGTATVIDEEDESRAGKARIHEVYGADPDAFPENVLVRIEIGTVFHKIF